MNYFVVFLSVCFWFATAVAADAVMTHGAPIPKIRPKNTEAPTPATTVVALPPELEPAQDTTVIVMPEPQKNIAPETGHTPSPALCHAEIFDRLAVGTRLRIIILAHEALSRETEIGPKGVVAIPMVGEIMAEGETIQSLTTQITERLEAANLISPGVDVEIIAYPPFYVTGLVANPGLYDYKPRITIRQAIALAGGFKTRARTSEFSILRHNPEAPLETIRLIAGEDTQVLPGDTIEVLRRWF